MRVLIVTAHPEENSYTFALSRVTESVAHQLGAEVMRSDLHQMGFQAGAGEDDFVGDLIDPFDLQDQQLIAFRSRTFEPTLMQEIDKLQACTHLVFHFPLWWYSMPGLMKGWIDRCFVYGRAYGRHGNLAGRRAMAVVATGGTVASFTAPKEITLDDYLKHLLIGTFQFCGMETFPTFAAYAPEEEDVREREDVLAAYGEHIASFLSAEKQG